MNASRPPKEEGFALFYALLVVLVVGGIIAVTLASATSELQQSAFELDFEDTVHIAEAGLEIKLQQLNTEPDIDDGLVGPTAGENLHDWALAEAVRETSPGVYALPVIDVGEGETVAIRPEGAGAEYVYGVGFSPSRDAFVQGIGEPYARVVRVQVGFTPTRVSGDNAVLVGGNMTISSNAWEVTGTNGSVHVNGAASINHDNSDGGITYSGSCTATCGGTITGPVEPKPIPLLEIEDPWGTDDATNITAAGQWYDYCAGQWYQRQQANTAPCTGTAVAPPAGWSGLSFNGTAAGATNPNKVFWIDAPGTVSVDKVTGAMTVIARGDINIGPSANVGPMTPHYPGLLLFTEGDADIGGNAESASTTEPGIVYVRGSLTLRGTMSSDGIAYIARDANVVGSFYNGGGDGGLNYDGGAVADLGGGGTPLVLRWEELRA